MALDKNVLIARYGGHMGAFVESGRWGKILRAAEQLVPSVMGCLFLRC